MSNEEANKVLEELHEVRPKKLNDKAKRLFEAIMTIANSRDEIEYKYKKALEDLVRLEKEKNEKIRELESDLYEANNRINDLLDIVKDKDELINLMAEEFINKTLMYNDWLKNDLIKYFEERCNNAKD